MEIITYDNESESKHNFYGSNSFKTVFFYPQEHYVQVLLINNLLLKTNHLHHKGLLKKGLKTNSGNS